MNLFCFLPSNDQKYEKLPKKKRSITIIASSAGARRASVLFSLVPRRAQLIWSGHSAGSADWSSSLQATWEFASRHMPISKFLRVLLSTKVFSTVPDAVIKELTSDAILVSKVYTLITSTLPASIFSFTFVQKKFNTSWIRIITFLSISANTRAEAKRKNSLSYGS